MGFDMVANGLLMCEEKATAPSLFIKANDDVTFFC